MPRIGVAMKEGTIVRWLKAEGEEVAAGEVVLAIENDKVEFEVESPWTGVVAELLAAKGTSSRCSSRSPGSAWSETKTRRRRCELR
jgi:pyruvate dehydrogenase E2 component (dihydrolipoamide acetyltransferase)